MNASTPPTGAPAPSRLRRFFAALRRVLTRPFRRRSSKPSPNIYPMF